MTNLQQFISDKIEIIIDVKSGESFVSKRGYSRMSGVPLTTLGERIKKMDASEITYARVPTLKGGEQTMMLIPEALVSQWVIKDCPELAFRMLAAGVRLFLHGVAGYRYEVKQVETTTTEPAKPAINPDNLDLLVDSLIHWRQNVKDYAADKPGFQRVLDHAVNSDNTKALPGVVPLCDLLGSQWDELSKGEKCWLGRTVSDCFKTTYEREPEIGWVTHYRPNGDPVKRRTRAYPTDFLPQIESAMETMKSVFSNR